MTHNTKHKLAILDDYQEVAYDHADWSSLSGDCEIQVFNQPFASERAAAEQLSGFSIVCCMRERTPFPASLLGKLPKLQLLITTGAKNASIDLTAASQQGVIVCGTESPGHAAAELAWALLMSLAKNLHIENAMIREGRWQTTIGSDLKNQTLGIVGLGRHGLNVARFAEAFGMQCIAWSQNLTEQLCSDNGVEYVDKETLFRRADFISIHLKMGKRNRQLIGEREFSLMKPSAYIINTSRGPIIDQNALIKALSEVRIAGAGLDVYDIEPLSADHPLLSLDNVLLAPHIGFVTRQTYDVFYSQTVDAVKNWLAGTPIRRLN